MQRYRDDTPARQHVRQRPPQVFDLGQFRHAPC
jgi:hypothetical protein